jgi:hypothetical protein
MEYNHSARGRLPAPGWRTLDVSPDNRDELQGSSRTTGGFFRGRAAGAVFNFADARKFMLILTLAYNNIDLF